MKLDNMELNHYYRDIIVLCCNDTSDDADVLDVLNTAVKRGDVFDIQIADGETSPLLKIIFMDNSELILTGLKFKR